MRLNGLIPFRGQVQFQGFLVQVPDLHFLDFLILRRGMTAGTHAAASKLSEPLFSVLPPMMNHNPDTPVPGFDG